VLRGLAILGVLTLAFHEVKGDGVDTVFVRNTGVRGTIAVGDSGHVYVAGFDNEGLFHVIKYGLTGTERWREILTPPDGAWRAFVGVDEQENVYAGYSVDMADLHFVTKYDSSGIALWGYSAPGSYRAAVVNRQGYLHLLGQFPNSETCGSMQYSWASTVSIVYGPGGGSSRHINGGVGTCESGTIVGWVHHTFELGDGRGAGVDEDGNVFVSGYSYACEEDVSCQQGGSRCSTTGVLSRFPSAGGAPDVATLGHYIPRGMVTDGQGYVYLGGAERSEGCNLENETPVIHKFDSNLGSLWASGTDSDSDVIPLAAGPEGVVYDGYNWGLTFLDGSGSVQWTIGDLAGRADVAIDWLGSTYIVQNGDVVRIEPTGELEWVVPITASTTTQPTVLVSQDLSVTAMSNEVIARIVQDLAFVRPQEGDHYLPGRRDSIMWEDGPEGVIGKLEYSIDLGETYEYLDDVPADEGTYYWDVPDTLLTAKAQVRMTEVNTGDTIRVSGQFTIKPYVISRLDENGDLELYDPEVHRWNFWNIEDHVWPEDWWKANFDYQLGIDRYTGKPYDQLVGGAGSGPGIFARADSSQFPDWDSWVRAFGEANCYTTEGDYRLLALRRWWWWTTDSGVPDEWGGSCFGIALSNALAFERRDDFKDRFGAFPGFETASEVGPTFAIIRPVTELFAHQYGQPSQSSMAVGVQKTPNETLEDLKAMLSEDVTRTRTLSMISFDPLDPGGHTILAYGLEQDTLEENYHYVWVYDNSWHEVIDAIILVDSDGNSGNGTWEQSYGNWGSGGDGWGGERGMYLENLATVHLSEAFLGKQSSSLSPFALSADKLQIFGSRGSPIVIEDQARRRTGFVDDAVINEIPGSTPIFVRDGSKRPPIGYTLDSGNYSVVLSDSESGDTRAGFFSGNRVFEYDRSGVVAGESDQLFFDGGLSAVNVDPQSKSVNLTTLTSNETDEAMVVVRSLELAPNDSVRLGALVDGRVTLMSYGGAKEYIVGLEYVSETGPQYFSADGVDLAANTSHTLIPDWPNLGTVDLEIVVDQGNDGTPDDTLRISNDVTGLGRQGARLVPGSFRLAQNYPNPFHDVTRITYDLPQPLEVDLRVFDLLGRALLVLDSGMKSAGSHSATFSAESLSAGVYFYRLEAGRFVETKSMIVLK
jgi:hypothetical protein